MDLQEFERRFGKEEQCLDYLFHLRWKDGYHCPRCQYHEMWKVRDFKYKCKKCGYQTTVIAGTLFQNTHIPLKLWFRAIWYVTSEEDRIKARTLQQELNLGSNRTALMMLKKIRNAMPKDNLEKLQGTVEVGREMILRSKPPRFLAVAVEIEHNRAGRIRAEIIEDTTFESIAAFIRRCVEQGSTIQCDSWDGRDKMMGQLYTYKQRAEEYEFPFVRKAINCFPALTGEEAKEMIDDYCSSHNSHNSHKQKATFEELLCNAIQSQPMPRR